MSVKVSALSKYFDQQQVLKGITFSASPGGILGFLGPNGAGKSTTMKIATGFIPATSGKIEVCGFDVSTHPMEARQRIGYLPEHNPLYTDMYVVEYLEFIGKLYKMKGDLLSKRVNEMIERVGLPSHRQKKIGELSKGFRQRVGLAQAMIHNPEVLILDEPTTGLDPNQIMEIRQVIREFGKEKTVIFSTHIMQEVQQLCERVVIINQGEIVADEEVSRLKDKNKGQKLLRVEFTGNIDIQILKAFGGVISVLEKQPTVFEVAYNPSKDIRPELFRLASEHGWTLVGMAEIENSLEKVFQDLTKTKL